MLRSSEAKLSSLRLLILSPASSPSAPSLFPPLLHALTETPPPPLLSEDGGSFAGYTSHPPLKLRTKYYKADVGIWCDEVPLPDATDGRQASAEKKGSYEAEAPPEEPVTLASWKEQMLSSEAAEVRAAIGGIIVVLPHHLNVLKSKIQSTYTPAPPDQGRPCLNDYLDLLETINELRETIEDENFNREIATVAVVQAAASKVQVSTKQEEAEAAAELIEGELMEKRGVLGWEVAGWDGVVEDVAVPRSSQRDEEGRKGKTGILRVIEALELVNWDSAADEGNAGDEDRITESLLGEDDDFPGQSGGGFNIRSEGGIRLQSHELEREMMGLKLAMRAQEEDRSPSQLGNGLEDAGGDEDDQIEQLQGLMERVVAIREAGAEMGVEERETFAKREVARIMREMG